MSSSQPASGAARIDVADEIEVAIDDAQGPGRSPGDTHDLDLHMSLDPSLVRDNPEPAGPGFTQHERGQEARDAQGQPQPQQQQQQAQHTEHDAHHQDDRNQDKDASRDHATAAPNRGFASRNGNGNSNGIGNGIGNGNGQSNGNGHENGQGSGSNHEQTAGMGTYARISLFFLPMSCYCCFFFVFCVDDSIACLLCTQYPTRKVFISPGISFAGVRVFQYEHQRPNTTRT